MPERVGISESSKNRLEALRAEIRRETGQSVTREALVSRIIERAHDSPDEVVELFRDSGVPLSEAEKEKMRDGRVSSGSHLDKDHDDVLY
jgi:hypothetical protein